MTAKRNGMVDLTSFFATLPANLELNVLRSALRAGAEEFADGAREECTSEEVRATIKTSSRAEPGLVTAKVQTKGKGAHKAPWLEYGTDEHEITVKGDTVSLVIDGKFVGKSVEHPGARAKPFIRPALATRETAAVDAIIRQARKRLTKEGLLTPDPEEREE
jgi:hypothetical protein